MNQFKVGDLVTFFQDTGSKMPSSAIRHKFIITKIIGDCTYRAQGVTYQKQVRNETDWWFSGRDLKLVHQTGIEKEICELESMGYRDTDDNPF